MDDMQMPCALNMHSQCPVVSAMYRTTRVPPLCACSCHKKDPLDRMRYRPPAPAPAPRRKSRRKKSMTAAVLGGIFKGARKGARGSRRSKVYGWGDSDGGD